jgi:hypothetical protein
VNKLSLILLMSLASGVAYAQSTDGGITTSTDPAKAAAVEQHAQELQARQAKEAKSTPTASHTSTKKAKTTKTSATHKSSTAKPAKAKS